MKQHRWYGALAAACVFAAGRPCLGEDLTGRFGVTGSAGAAWPIAPSYVTSAVDPVGYVAGLEGSLDVSPHIGMAVSWDHLGLGPNLRGDLINLLLRLRFFPDRVWTPTFEVGPGSAAGVNSSRIENINLKSTLGLDYFFAPEWAAGPQVTYFYISHSADASTYAHLITFGLHLSHYFKAN